MSKPIIWKRISWWHWRVRGRLAVWLADRLCGEDMLWDAEDPENPWESMDEWADNSWGPRDGGQQTTITFQRALRLPNRTYRVTSIAHDASDDIDFKFERAAKASHR